jgi:hypothetical protein
MKIDHRQRMMVECVGWRAYPSGRERCSHDIGTQMHRVASRFAIDAQTASVSNDVRPALASLGTVMQQCVACHAIYRLHCIASNGESSKAAPTMVDSRAGHPATLS